MIEASIDKVLRNSRSILIAIVVVQLFAGLLYAIYLGDELRFLPDEEHYVNLATNLAQKLSYSIDGHTPTAYRPPGYPFFLSLFRLVGANILLLRILNYLLLAASTCLVYLTLKKQRGPLAGILGAFMVVAYPVFFFTASTLYPQTLASLLLIAIFYIISANQLRLKHFVIIGALFTWLILTVPTFAFAWLVFTIWLFSRRFQFKYILVGIAVVFLFLSAWWVRNYSVFDEFVFVSTNGGENFLLGNSENTTPNAGRRVSIHKYESAASEMTEIERDRYFTQQAISYIRNNKGRSLQLYFLKVGNYFNFQNQLVTKTGLEQMRDIIMLLTYGPILLIFILRLLYKGRYPLSPFESLMVILYIANAFFSAIFFTRIRFRLPFDYLAIMVVALFIARLIANKSQTSGVHEEQVAVV